jgi:hypothetical protein
MINIYNVDGGLLMQAELTSSAKREEELSKSDYISLSWNADTKVVLPAGAYIQHTYKIDTIRSVTRNFLLLESYEPTQSDEQTWKYSPEFQHPKMILGKVPFYIWTKNSKNETIKNYVWSFVGVTRTLGTKLIDFLNNDIKFGNCGWTCVISDNVTNTVNVSFSDNDFISSLTAICNAIGDNCEWHIDYDNEIIYLGKVSIGTAPVELKIGENIGTVSISSSREDYYNSFAVFGGTRNITQVNSKGENISSGDIRLQLNAGEGSIEVDGKTQTFTIDDYSTIDLRKDTSKEQLFTKVLDFSDVFPSLNTYVYNVRGREKYVIDSNATGTDKRTPLTYNEDGSVATYKTFTVWYMRLAYPSVAKEEGKTLLNTTIDDGVTHYWYDFEITDNLKVNGKNLSCSFEANFNEGALSTPLAGQGNNGDYVGFELTYHDHDSSSHSSDDVSDENFEIKAGDYEIVYQEDNNVYIPSNANELIIPKGENKPSFKCNITVLYNIAMADTYYTSAQAELLDTAEEEIIRLMSDLNNYTFKAYPQVFAEGNPCLQIGQLVKYNDGNGYELETRVLKLSTNLDYEYAQEITVGNQAIKGTLTQLKDDVQSIIASGGSNGGSSYTPSQLSNLIGKYGTSFFLSKLYEDKAESIITFLKGIGIGTSYGIDESGYAKLGEVVLDLLSSYDFNYSEQTGFAFTKRTDGKYKLSLTDLEVWGKAVFNQLEIRKLSYVGGNYIFSPAGSKIVCVKSGTEGILWPYYRCYYLADDGTTATQNLWSVGDLALCEEFNVVNHADNTVSANKRYWRKVVAVSSANEVITDDNGNELYGGQKFGYVDLSRDNCETGSDEPAAGDTIACVGNVSDTDRQNVITINTVGDDAPAIIQYSGISTYSLTDKVVTKLSPKGNVIKGELYTEDGKNVKENIGTLQEEMSGMSNSVSEIKQTAEKLSLTVTRTAVRDRNLLANSYVSLASTLYGFCTREVSLEKGKTYTLSVKGYSVASGGELKVYVFAEDSDDNWTWSNSVSITDTTETTASVTFSDVPSSGTYHVRCFSAPSGSGKLVFVRYIQLEEGEVATPWSMNESDPAAYGNLLPDMGNNQWSYEDNVTKKDGVSLPDGNYYMTYHVENTETDDEDAIWLDSTFYPGNGESYTLSFWAKGSGTMSVWIDSGCCYAINSEGLKVTTDDGLVFFQLTSEWKRYWATWSTNVSDGMPREVLVMRVAGGSDITAAGFKLEPYGRMTEYTQEQITGEDLLGTGIDIEHKKITVTADQFTIQNNHGSKTFSVDENGLVTMNHIAVGGMINKCPVDVTKAKFATLFDTWQDIVTTHWYGRPKMEQMYGIYYINEATGLSQTGMPLTLYMPSVYVNPDGQYYGDVFDDDGNLSNTLLRNVRSLVGNTILIYNESSEDIAINGMSPYFVDVWQSSSSAKAVTLQAASTSTQTKGDTASDATDGLDKPVVDGDISPNERYVGRKRNELTVTLLGGKHHFVSLTCVCEVGHLGWENIYWLVNYGQAMNT